MLATPCETCSTSSWTSSAVVRPESRPATIAPDRRAATTTATTAGMAATTGTTATDGDDRGDDSPGGSSDGDRDRQPPRPIRPVRRGGGGPSLRRQVLIIVGILVAVFVVLMLAIGVELWTDAIWYTSVGYDAVFWRRLWVQVGLFVFGAVLVLLVLLGNLWLAGRLLPPASGDGGTLRTLIDRLNEAAERTQDARGSRGAPWENPTRPPWRGHRRHPRRHSGPDLAGPRDHRGRRGPDRAHDRRLDRRGLADDPPLAEPRAVRAGRREPRGRPGVRQGHRLLPLRSRVPALRPGDDHRRARGGDRRRRRPLPRRRAGRQPRLQHARSASTSACSRA